MNRGSPVFAPGVADGTLGHSESISVVVQARPRSTRRAGARRADTGVYPAYRRHANADSAAAVPDANAHANRDADPDAGCDRHTDRNALADAHGVAEPVPLARAFGNAAADIDRGRTTARDAPAATACPDARAGRGVPNGTRHRRGTGSRRQTRRAGPLA